MAGESNGVGGGLYFVAGALVLAAGVIAYFALGGQRGGERRDFDIKIEAPRPDAAKTPR